MTLYVHYVVIYNGEFTMGNLKKMVTESANIENEKPKKTWFNKPIAKCTVICQEIISPFINPFVNIINAFVYSIYV